MDYLISIPNSSRPAVGATAAAFLIEAKAHPVYGITPFTTVAQVLPYLQAAASQLSADFPSSLGVKNKTTIDARVQTLLAEMIVAAGG